MRTPPVTLPSASQDKQAKVVHQGAQFYAPFASPANMSELAPQINGEYYTRKCVEFVQDLAVDMDFRLRALTSIKGFVHTLNQDKENFYDAETRSEFLQIVEQDTDRATDWLQNIWREARLLSANLNADAESSMPLYVSIVATPNTADFPLPAYQTDGAAGMDLYAAVESQVVLLPGERLAVPTGILIAVPPGFEAQVRPRSGLARKYGIGMVNAPGTIDSDYRGEVQVLLINHGSEPFTIARGDRIAQLIVAPVVRVAWKIAANLDETSRGTGGFGHTGGHQT